MTLRQNLITSIFLLVSLQANFAISQGYVMDPNWPKPLPEGIEWGQVPNVTIDDEGFIYAFHRSDRPVLKFDPEETWWIHLEVKFGLLHHMVFE